MGIDAREDETIEAVMPCVKAQQVLSGQTALVTGASSGIGLAIARSLGEAGADVVINYVAGEDEAQALVEAIRASGSRAIAIRADVSDEVQVQEMFRRRSRSSPPSTSSSTMRACNRTLPSKK